jgi:hypothetical protein
MVPRQALTVTELPLAPMAVLTPITIAGEEECVGDLAAEAAGHMNELDEANNSWFRQCQSFTSDDIAGIRFDDLGFPFDYETKGSPQRDHCEWLKGGV